MGNPVVAVFGAEDATAEGERCRFLEIYRYGKLVRSSAHGRGLSWFFVTATLIDPSEIGCIKGIRLRASTGNGFDSGCRQEAARLVPRRRQQSQHGDDG